MRRRLQARTPDQRGFTLIELLVVIVILGILSAVVVFAVRGSGDRGQSAAVSTDEKTIRTAEEAYCAKFGRYGSGQDLVDEQFLSDLPKYHQVNAQPSGGSCNGWRFSILRTAQAGAYPPGRWDTIAPPTALGHATFVVRLPDGKVLAGGYDNALTAYAAQVWDPSTSGWSDADAPPSSISDASNSALLLTDDPTTPQSECQGTVNNCGKVLVFGRLLFDPAVAPETTGQWQVIPGVSGCNICTNGTYNHTYIQLKNSVGPCGSQCGNVFIFANSGTGSLGLDSFDPRTNSYTTYPYPDADTEEVAEAGNATQLSDGRVFFCCVPGTGGVRVSKFFDPIGPSFSDAPAAPSRYFRAVQVQPLPRLPNGDLFFGFASLPRLPGRYTPDFGVPGTWTTHPNCVPETVPFPRQCRVVSGLLDGRIVTSRGFFDSTATNEMYVFNPATNLWSRTGDIVSTLSYTRDALLLDPAEGPCGAHCGKVIVVGQGSAELYSP